MQLGAQVGFRGTTLPVDVATQNQTRRSARKDTEAYPKVFQTFPNVTSQQL